MNLGQINASMKYSSLVNYIFAGSIVLIGYDQGCKAVGEADRLLIDPYAEKIHGWMYYAAIGFVVFLLLWGMWLVGLFGK